MLLTPAIHRFFFILGIAITLGALPYSPYILSVGIFTFSINWLLDGSWATKFKRLVENKYFWFFTLVYLSIVISFFYSQNLHRALIVLRTWVPIIVIPLVIVSSDPLRRNEFRFLMLIYCSAVIISTVFGLIYYIRDFQHLGQNVRYLSPFILHIRFSLMVIMAIFILIYMVLYDKAISNRLKLLLVLFIIWLITYLLILQSLTGLIIFSLVIIILPLWWSYTTHSQALKYILLLVFLSVLLLALSYVAHTVDKFYTQQVVDFKNLPDRTANNNPYFHDTLNVQFENGFLVWVNISPSELKSEWEKVSNLPYDGLDHAGHKLEHTLIRYMASKGLAKDSLGFSKLDSVDIRLVENSVTSVIFREHKAGIYPRLYQLLWEIDEYRYRGAVSGSSVIQRFIYMKSALHIIRNNLFFGVGVGDGQQVIFDYYRDNVKNLDQKNWKTSHNQFLNVLIASGLVGLIMFLVGLLYPFFSSRSYKELLPFVFMMVTLLSMFSIETFERHSGASFVAIFYSIFILSSYFIKGDTYGE